ncbi:phage head closure protein [Salibacterium lacus]|uniref:Phage head closure protein n=1 Tax=Salibacterium lacus TaxID=1898109 RepID=A0ABW5SWL0_9BACI
MKPIRAGKFKHRISILKEDRVRKPGGEYETDWVEHLKSRARVVPLSGSERYEAQQVQSTMSHRVEMRYRPGIKPQMRVEYDGRILKIEAVLNLEEADRELHLMTSEVVT